ncbi:hypothetical protein GUJ93_ZPchr0005g15032 [Zizania palustris]|uniref:Uncharacterized protein n=1 Tax=Zizania palustris TaxID=103762 RepID=A0A8J5SY42_ZIZPA|nr:hypothetical protein GUJ93_ZPchr0005g15032 [Zizania palustris]
MCAFRRTVWLRVVLLPPAENHAPLRHRAPHRETCACTPPAMCACRSAARNRHAAEMSVLSPPLDCNKCTAFFPQYTLLLCCMAAKRAKDLSHAAESFSRVKRYSCNQCAEDSHATESHAYYSCCLKPCRLLCAQI